jgi:hypothetical protein
LNVLTLISNYCCSFAFVDFATTEHATSVLVNPKNHFLNGRKLVLEYAGADAVRRGASKMKIKREEGATLPRRQKAGSCGLRAERIEHKRRLASTQSKEGDEQPAKQSTPVVFQRSSEQRYGRGDKKTRSNDSAIKVKGPKVRPKPGAALALARRETAAILPSQGNKITF